MTAARRRIKEGGRQRAARRQEAVRLLDYTDWSIVNRAGLRTEGREGVLLKKFELGRTERLRRWRCGVFAGVASASLEASLESRPPPGF